MILANVRAKKEVAGDLRAQISAINLGLRRLSAVLDRYGLDTVRFYVQELLDYTEKRTRAELAKLPQGTYEAEGMARRRRNVGRARPPQGAGHSRRPPRDVRFRGDGCSSAGRR